MGKNPRIEDNNVMSVHLLSEDIKRKEEIEKINNIVKYVVLGILIVWLWNWGWLILIDSGARGTFGDMFGGVNALFSGLAFVGVIYAVLLQRKELEYQRKELELTRKEIGGQREAQEAQSETLKLQQFEGIFFNMLRTQQEITNSITTRLEEINYGGREALSVLAGEFEIVYLSVKGTPTNNRMHGHHPSFIFQKSGYGEVDFIGLRDKYRDDEDNALKVAYKVFFKANHNQLGHYYRHLYQILAYIYKAYSNEEEWIVRMGINYTPEEFYDIFNKYLEYANIVQAQMSSAELSLYFYYGMNYPKTKKLLELFNFLKPIALEDLLDGSHKNYYKTDFKHRETVS